MGEEAISENTVNGAAIDLDHLRLYTAGDPSLEGEVLGLFEAQAGLLLNALDPRAGDHAWRDAAHTLKGSARGIGAWRVANCAEFCETLVGSDQVSAREAALGPLRREIEAALAQIATLVSAD